MAQARLTDYFAQSKKGGIDRAARGKGQKANAVNVDVAVARPTRQNTRTAGRPKITRSSSVQEEFLRVINEAVSTSDEAKFTEDKVDIHASPKTPKRRSTEVEFDLGSAVFTTAEQHSSAKKRARVGPSQEGNTVAEKAAVKTGKRTARKRLILSKDGEQVSNTLELLLLSLT